LAAKNSYLGRVFLDWAQYPITETEILEGAEQGYIVRLQDLRYVGVPRAIGGNRGRRVLGAAIKLDNNLHIVGDVYDTGKEQIVVPEPRER